MVATGYFKVNSKIIKVEFYPDFVGQVIRVKVEMAANLAADLRTRSECSLGLN